MSVTPHVTRSVYRSITVIKNSRRDIGSIVSVNINNLQKIIWADHSLILIKREKPKEEISIST